MTSKKSIPNVVRKQGLATRLATWFFLGVLLFTLSFLVCTHGRAQETESPPPQENGAPSEPVPSVEKPVDPIKEKPSAPAPTPSPAADSNPSPKSEGSSPKLPESWKLNSWEMSGQDFTHKVVVIKIGEDDLMNSARFNFMHRVIKKAAAQNAKAILFEMDTPGGEAWKTSTLMNLLLESPIPTLTFVNRRAISAGALISIATDRIYMTPGSVIGAATPVAGDGSEIGEDERAKLNSALMALARSVAQAKGHHPEIANAFVDKDSGLVIEGQEIWPKGKPLTLDDQQASKIYGNKPLLATAVVSNMAEVLRAENLSSEIIVAQPTGFELFSMFVTTFSWLFILVGIWGVMTEIKTPGFGFPGILGGTAFFIFFLGHYVSGYLPGLEWVALFLIGIVLIAIEFFIFPGTFVAALLGAFCLVASLIMTMSDGVQTPDFAPESLPELGSAVVNLTVGLAGAVILMLIVFPFLPKVPGFSWLSLEATVGSGHSQNAQHLEGSTLRLPLAPGTEGVALTELRPVGNARFGDLDIEVTAGDAFIDAGIRVRVVRSQFGIYLVEALEQNKVPSSKDVTQDPSVLG